MSAPVVVDTARVARIREHAAARRAALDPASPGDATLRELWAQMGEVCRALDPAAPPPTIHKGAKP